MIGRNPERRTWPAATSIAMLLLLPLVPAPSGGGAVGDVLAPSSGLAAQVRTPAVGTVEAALLLRRMDGEKRVLMIGAHPDDEDTALLAALARGMGARTAYLSLSRGEGGQNVIGPELGEGLGLVRTGELLAARALDGAEQYFTRAFDFGFSKSAEETLRHWPEEELLRDVVEVVRRFRPHVIVSIFSGTPRDGHGQHQASGLVSHAAFHAAADPDRFPEQLAALGGPWAAAKLYRLVRRNPEAATVSVATGTLDPLLGRSHFQVAMESRSRHRSQDMGVPQVPGPRRTGAELADARVPLPGGDDDGLFAGVDTTLQGLARAAGGPSSGALEAEIAEYRDALRAAEGALLASRPGAAAPHLARAAGHATAALELARDLPEGAGRRELMAVLEDRIRMTAEVRLAASLVVVDARVDRARTVPGEELEVEVQAWNGGDEPLRVEDLSLALPPGWEVLGAVAEAPPPPEGMQAFFAPDARSLEAALPSGADPVLVPPGELRRWNVRVRVPAGAAPSRPYFLSAPREGALYRWPDDPALRGRALDPPLITVAAALRLEADGEPGRRVRIERPATHVGVDPVEGEYRVPLFVVPAVSLEVDPARLAWPAGDEHPRAVTVRAVNFSEAALDAELRWEVPEGWRVEAEDGFADGGSTEDLRMAVPPRGGESVRRFVVRPPAARAGPDGAGTAVLTPSLRVDGRAYREGVTEIDYRHVDPMLLFRPAELRISRFPVRVRTGLRVGYVMGSGDDGPQALRDLGIEVEPLDAAALRSGDLSRFHTVVLGIRAYETRPDLAAANEALLAFARAGGTVVVQYHRYEYPEGGFAPYPLRIARPHDRVTDHEAPVTLLDPDHPLLRAPNRITEADFEGWVQERGLYFPREWDARYVPLLEMADPDEDPTRGALLVAPVGRGAYVYTGLALFRQLPAGVAGAHRLLANLVSLRGEDLPRPEDVGR